MTPPRDTALRGRHARESRGRLVAEILSGSWRAAPPAPHFDADALATATPLLLDSGSAALAWWRVRHTPLAESAAARELRDAYRFYTLQAEVQAACVAELVTRLRGAGVEPVLHKGLSAARLYAEPGLRPHGDVDLIVRPEQRADAVAALRAQDLRHVAVDLEHTETDLLNPHAWDELYERTRVAHVGGAEVRVLGAEDELRLLSVHMLRHGARRPAWLCDIAAALEALPQGFDWDYCLGPAPRVRELVEASVALARTLLGARVGDCDTHADDDPHADDPRSLPRWLVPHVLTRWGRPLSEEARAGELLSLSARRPWRLPGALGARWPDALQATVRRGGPLEGRPRILFQLGDFFGQAASFLRSAVGSAGARPGRGGVRHTFTKHS